MRQEPARILHAARLFANSKFDIQLYLRPRAPAFRPGLAKGGTKLDRETPVVPWGLDFFPSPPPLKRRAIIFRTRGARVARSCPSRSNPTVGTAGPSAWAEALGRYDSKTKGIAKATSEERKAACPIPTPAPGSSSFPSARFAAR